MTTSRPYFHAPYMIAVILLTAASVLAPPRGYVRLIVESTQSETSSEPVEAETQDLEAIRCESSRLHRSRRPVGKPVCWKHTSKTGSFKPPFAHPSQLSSSAQRFEIARIHGAGLPFLS